MIKCTVKQDSVNGYDLHRIPGLICTESGKLLAYYECRKTEDDWAAIDIALKTSTDGGEIWSSDRVLVEGKGKNVNNPVMLADGADILFMWQEEYHRTFCRKSFDEGETWGEITEITESLRTKEYPWTVIACGPGHGTVLKSGRYIVPVWLCSNLKDPKAHAPSLISTIYSDNKGMSWKLGELIRRKELINPSETSLAQLTDGRVMLNIRHMSEQRRRVIAYSDSGVSDWYDLRFEESLPDPICMGSLVAHEDKVYFFNCNSEDKREKLTLYESCDKGMTWNEIIMVSQAAGYSDIAVSPDGSKIYIFFEEFHYKPDQELDRSKSQSLMFAIIEV